MKIVATPGMLEVNEARMHLGSVVEYKVGSYSDVLQAPVTLRHAEKLADKLAEEHKIPSYSSVHVDFEKTIFTFHKIDCGEGWGIGSEEVGKLPFQLDVLRKFMPSYSKYLKIVGPPLIPQGYGSNFRYSENPWKDLEKRLNSLQVEDLETVLSDGEHGCCSSLLILVTDKFTIDVKY